MNSLNAIKQPPLKKKKGRKTKKEENRSCVLVNYLPIITGQQDQQKSQGLHNSQDEAEVSSVNDAVSPWEGNKILYENKGSPTQGSA